MSCCMSFCSPYLRCIFGVYVCLLRSIPCSDLPFKDSARHEYMHGRGNISGGDGRMTLFNANRPNSTKEYSHTTRDSIIDFMQRNSHVTTQRSFDLTFRYHILPRVHPRYFVLRSKLYERQ